MRMTNAFPFMSATPGKVRHGGPKKGQHNDEIFIEELGLSAEDVQALKDEGVI
jgi:formyl-CoA transferase